MKIVSLGVENIKRVVAVEIAPDGNLVQITGKNGNGKTSILDAIWWGLAGKGPIQSKPIRNGANHASVTLVLGDPASDDPKKRRELTITRTFSREDDGGYTTAIRVKNAEGWAPAGGGQTLLDGMLGALSFDPLAFDRMKTKEQFDELTQFVPDFDFAANAGQCRATYERRTDVNRLAKDAASAAAMIAIPDNTPPAPVDEAKLVDELQKANEHNSQIERRKENRQRHADKMASLHVEASRLQQQANELRRQSDDLLERSKLVTAEADGMGEELSKADPLPPAIPVESIVAKMAAARVTNAAVARRQTRQQHLATAKKYEKESETLTVRIAELEQEKQSAIAKAHMPVDGLGFGDGVVLLNGLPFEQASDAERLRASVAIAARSNPSLRVIRVRDGSLLDPDGMKLLAEMADANDMQVWVERVDASGEVGFVIEDGRLKGQELPVKSEAEAPVEHVPAAARKKAARKWQGPGAPKDAA